MTSIEDCKTMATSSNFVEDEGVAHRAVDASCCGVSGYGGCFPPLWRQSTGVEGKETCKIFGGFDDISPGFIS
jgi:hypothetical protein